jgi:hypothetical protein
MSRHADRQRELEESKAVLRRARQVAGLAPSRKLDPHPTYVKAHVLVRDVRGPASQLPCAHCDGWAAQWAYDHRGDPELVDHQGRRYAADPERYLPLCHRCHSSFDRTEV